jgi:hypothetical protein
LLETGAANPTARTLNTSDAEMGEMMRMVIAHEVGHAPSFPHMGASCAYDTENYRNGEFTAENGIAASLMDYARFNYIAQPEIKTFVLSAKWDLTIIMLRIGDIE